MILPHSGSLSGGGGGGDRCVGGGVRGGGGGGGSVVVVEYMHTLFPFLVLILNIPQPLHCPTLILCLASRGLVVCMYMSWFDS